MEDLTLEQLKALAQQTQDPSVSIYLPTHRAGPETQQDPIRFRNLLREAERRLQEKGMGARNAADFLQAAQALLEDSSFWRHQYDGLAVFLAAGDFHAFRLPFRVEEMLTVARSYYVKPILPLFTNNGHYYILAISQNDVRLFEGTRHSIGQIDLPEGAPQSMDEALQYDDPEKQLQFHTGTPQGGGRDAMFHGHGAGDEDQKVRIERYFNLVDHGLRELLQAQQAPLILAGVDYLLPIYRKVSEYAKIMPDGIEGSAERMRADELQERAWRIVEPYFRRETEDTLAQYQQLAGTGRVSSQIEEVVAAAHFGRVDKLILAADTPVWGVFDRESGKVLHHQEGLSEDDDLALVDFAATQTLQNGGTVYALSQKEMPAGSPVIAVLRY